MTGCLKSHFDRIREFGGSGEPEGSTKLNPLFVIH